MRFFKEKHTRFFTLCTVIEIGSGGLLPVVSASAILISLLKKSDKGLKILKKTMNIYIRNATVQYKPHLKIDIMSPY